MVSKDTVDTSNLIGATSVWVGTKNCLTATQGGGSVARTLCHSSRYSVTPHLRYYVWSLEVMDGWLEDYLLL